MICFKNILFTSLFVLNALAALPAFATDDIVQIEMESLRQQTSEDKERLVAANMNLTESEAKAFWPIYDSYQNDLYKINVRLASVLNEYALAYNKGAVMDDTAKKLLSEAIAIDLDEAKLKQSYVPKLSKALPSVKVARYIQIENKIRAVIRYMLADAIPLVE